MLNFAVILLGLAVVSQSIVIIDLCRRVRSWEKACAAASARLGAPDHG